MKKIILIFSLLVGQAFASHKDEGISQTLMKEWNKFRAQVEKIEPQGDIGGYMLYRDYQDMTLLWKTSDNKNENEVIRFFMLRPTGEVFAITYHKSDIIHPGKTVLRRFVGTEPTGWINHTIDFNTGDYLGPQGQEPELTAAEKKLMKDWGISKL